MTHPCFFDTRSCRGNPDVQRRVNRRLVNINSARSLPGGRISAASVRLPADRTSYGFIQQMRKFLQVKTQDMMFGICSSSPFFQNSTRTDCLPFSRRHFLSEKEQKLFSLFTFLSVMELNFACVQRHIFSSFNYSHLPHSYRKRQLYHSTSSFSFFTPPLSYFSPNSNTAASVGKGTELNAAFSSVFAGTLFSHKAQPE